MKSFQMLSSVIGVLMYAYLAVGAVCDFFSGAMLSNLINAINDPVLVGIMLLVMLCCGTSTINTGIPLLAGSKGEQPAALVPFLGITYGLTFYFIHCSLRTLGGSYLLWLIFYTSTFILLDLLFEHIVPQSPVWYPEKTRHSNPPKKTRYLKYKLPFVLIFVGFLLTRHLWS